MKDLKIYYMPEEGNEAYDFEGDIEVLLAKYGLKRWASGTNLGTGVRDLAFDKSRAPKNDGTLRLITDDA